MTIILLTLEAHQSGIWNTLLIDRLKQKLSQEEVKIATLESTLTSISNPFPSDTTLLVNRVSDATSLYKATVALLQCCEHIWNIPVWNGVDAYGLLANKWCHSTLLEQAGLASPSSRRVHHSTIDMVPETVPFSSILFKPNAGGFGAGIIKVKGLQELRSSHLSSAIKTNDDMAVLQQYIEPQDNRLYRIWFLRGKVQCGLIRQNYEGVDEFTTGCAAKGACSMQDRTKKQPRLIAYSIPKEVCDELENKLLPLIPDAHCGSVEYLCDRDGNRFYFDINLLSTLPLLETIENATEIWSAAYDPWIELAQAIVDYLPDKAKV